MYVVDQQPVCERKQWRHCARGKQVARYGVWLLLLLVYFITQSAGCSRTRYRLATDQDVDSLIAEKSHDPRWAYPNYTVYVDPRSRYFDPTNLDHPPLPQDDPASHQFMHILDGKRHWPHWHDDGDRQQLESPCWMQQLPSYVELTDRGEVKLNIESAMKLTHIHSPDYWQQVETLYLSALDVSTERFRFATQFYGGTGLLFQHLGRDRTAAGESNTLSLGNSSLTNLGGQNTIATRRLATGGELLVGFANSMVWQFAGPDQYSNISILNFNFVQPLLRFGGRAVALEQLTIAERNMLANLRSFQRYRQGNYTNIAVGDLNVTGPQRQGGFLGGTGLTGFSGQGNGGFGGVGTATNLGRAGFGAAGNGQQAGAGGAGFAGGGAGNIGGFLGLLQSSQQIRNTQDSLNLQQRTLKLLEANLNAGLIDIVQVDQFRQNILSEQANLLQAELNQENALDTFKRQTLGLPPGLPMKLDDTLIKQFQFIDPETTAYQNATADFVEALGDLPEPATIEIVRSAIERFKQLRDKTPERFTQTRDDLKKLDGSVAGRERLMKQETEKLAFEAERTLLAKDLKQLEERFLLGTVELAAVSAKLAPATAQKTLEELVGLSSSLAGLITELSLVQARARLEAVTIEPIELHWTQALEIARGNRLDWMNNRATLVDTWRLITFNANALKSNLQVTIGGDIQTKGNDPLRFRAPTGSMRAGIRFDAPFTRLLERNNYRQVLIDYQQDRRTLIRFEDQVSQTLRQDLRLIEQLRENLELQRKAVATSVRRVDKTREDLNEPPPPVQPGQPVVQLGPTASLNLLTAISDLRNSQNNFISVWLNYHSERMQLARDLGIMKLDEHGLWVDVSLEEMLGAPVDDLYPLPPSVPNDWLNECAIEPGELNAPSEPVPTPPKSDALPTPDEPGPRLFPGDAPPIRSQTHLRELEASELEVRERLPDQSDESPSQAKSNHTAPVRETLRSTRYTGPVSGNDRPSDHIQRGRIRAGAKRWVDLVRRRNAPNDLERSIY